MAADLQHTLASAVSFSGVGLHSGDPVQLSVRPAPAGNGIVFRRVDLEGDPEIPADRHHVVASSRGTRLRGRGAEVQTVEHLLSALRGLGVTFRVGGAQVSTRATRRLPNPAAIHTLLEWVAKRRRISSPRS